MNIPQKSNPEALSNAIPPAFSLTGDYSLSREQVGYYQTKGHIFLPQLATGGEVAFYRNAIREAVEKLNTEKRALKDRDTYGKAFLQIFNLWRTTEVLKTFVLAKRFGKVAAQLMGVDRVRIYHDQALFKEPGGGKTPWHQDQFYWPLDTNNTITLWMPLIDLNKNMGIMQFASGSHTNGYILSKEISDESEAFFENYIKGENFAIEGPREAKAGDATFHSGWTLHHAPANNTAVTREVMTIIYYADKTKILKPDSAFRENDLKTWLGGRLPGEEAESPMNPLV
jgi:ectoine hydroxylase-related dioxygenase (phytanoyl-CoA dioxygenase family)